MKRVCDYIILGAGMYGLYAALYLLKKGKTVVIIEHDEDAFRRASYTNQARVHFGYHYPRSFSTATKSANYFERFNNDFKFAINSKFKKIYSISKKYSFTSGEQFKKFCRQANIPCKEVSSADYFKEGYVDGVFETVEYSYDAHIIKEFFLSEINKYDKVKFFYSTYLEKVEEKNETYAITLNNGDKIEGYNILNATYASINQIIDKFGFQKFSIKYEICEIILCKTSENIKDTGVTMMDGPFFSLMPFGFSGYHSLSSVTFTPHKTCYDLLPKFNCQNKNKLCTSINLENCNSCIAKPETAWMYMSQLAKKYLLDEIEMSYDKSLWSIKPILSGAELDDSRPTLIKEFSSKPRFLSVLSGKINTVYDLDEVLV